MGQALEMSGKLESRLTTPRPETERDWGAWSGPRTAQTGAWEGQSLKRRESWARECDLVSPSGAMPFSLVAAGARGVDANDEPQSVQSSRADLVGRLHKYGSVVGRGAASFSATSACCAEGRIAVGATRSAAAKAVRSTARTWTGSQ